MLSWEYVRGHLRRFRAFILSMVETRKQSHFRSLDAYQLDGGAAGAGAGAPGAASAAHEGSCEGSVLIGAGTSTATTSAAAADMVVVRTEAVPPPTADLASALAAAGAGMPAAAAPSGGVHAMAAQLGTPAPKHSSFSVAQHLQSLAVAAAPAQLAAVQANKPPRVSLDPPGSPHSVVRSASSVSTAAASAGHSSGHSGGIAVSGQPPLLEVAGAAGTCGSPASSNGALSLGDLARQAPLLLAQLQGVLALPPQALPDGVAADAPGGAAAGPRRRGSRCDVECGVEELGASLPLPQLYAEMPLPAFNGC